MFLKAILESVKCSGLQNCVPFVMVFFSGESMTESGARQRNRRIGHSGPPTGDFQLYGNTGEDSSSSDDDDDANIEETRR